MLLESLRKYTENAWHIWYFYVAYFFPCLQVCTESLLFGTQQKEVSCAQHDLVWPIKWKWISSLHIKFCWIPFAQESKIAVSCSSVLIHFLSDSHISLFSQILKFLLAVILQISHSPNTVTPVSTEVPAGRQALGFPPVGSRLGGHGTIRALVGRALLPCTPQARCCSRGCGFLELLPATASPRVSLCFSKAHTASASRMLLHPPSSAPFHQPPLLQQKPQGPHAAQIPIHLVHGWWGSPCSPHAKYSMDVPGCVLDPSPRELWSSKRFPFLSSAACSSTQNTTSHLRY